MNGNYTDIAGLRKRVGGRSLYWHGVVLPIEDRVLADPLWPRPVVDDLTRDWRGGPGLYARELAVLEEWTGRRLERGPADGAELDGLPGFAFFPAPRAVRPVGDDGRWEAYSPLDTPTPATVSDTRVVDVLVRDGRARGVRVERAGTVSEMFADRVVLAAGTMENSRLAIRALTAAGHRGRAELGGLVDKIAQGIVVTAAPDALPEPWRGLVDGGAVMIAPLPGPHVGNLFLNASRTPSGMAVLDFYVMGEQPPGHGGCVRLTDDGRILVLAEHGTPDQVVIEAQRELLRHVWDRVRTHLCLPAADLAFTDPLGSEDLAEALFRPLGYDTPRPPTTYSFRLGSEQHEAGTLPFGTLLSPDGELLGVDGLYVTGPAAFPRSGAANPALTVLALGRRLGAHLAAA